MKLDKADEEYEGPWEVVVYGECGKDNFKSKKRRGKRQAAEEELATLIENPALAAQISPAENKPVKFPSSPSIQNAGGVQTLLGQIPKIKNHRTP